MSQEILEQQIRHCVDIIADTANSMSDNRYGLDIDDIECCVSECHHLLNRLENYLKQYQDRDD